MFTLAQMQQAHTKVKSGADFPAYIREIKALGLITYDFMVADGSTIYHGVDAQINSEAKYSALEISPIPSTQLLKNTITEHQQGRTDFMTFCKLAAEAGVEKWVIDTRKMMCTYYDLAGNEMVAEPIPDAGY